LGHTFKIDCESIKHYDISIKRASDAELTFSVSLERFRCRHHVRGLRKATAGKIDSATSLRGQLFAFLLGKLLVRQEGVASTETDKKQL
jgi:hypothetical protein